MFFVVEKFIVNLFLFIKKNIKMKNSSRIPFQEAMKKYEQMETRFKKS